MDIIYFLQSAKTMQYNTFENKMESLNVRALFIIFRKEFCNILINYLLYIHNYI